MRRTVPLWPARIVARARLLTTAQFDPLTRQYRLERSLSLRVRGDDQPEAPPEQRTTESFEEVSAWMTEVGIGAPLELPVPGLERRARVHVASAIGRRYVMLLFPAKLVVSDERVLER